MSFGRPPGAPSGYVDTYTPTLLHGIERARARARLGISDALPFRGEDVWTGYELSWLNGAGKPLVAGLRLRVPCTSPNLVESKSMKLYLNGFAQTRFGDRADVASTLQRDLTGVFGSPVGVTLLDVDCLGGGDRMPGDSLDELEVAVSDYERNPEWLQMRKGTELRRPGGRTGSKPDAPRPAPPPSGCTGERVTETFHTHLFRSLCPITAQPDWASVLIRYTGVPVDPEGLLRYLVSYRRHAAFHEDTIEQIFMDIMQRCRPEGLTVFGRFLRRGGLDINPFRSTVADQAPDLRLARQ